MFLELRFGILTGRYLPGQVLDRSKLCEVYDCRAVPATEVLSTLVAEGYLVRQKRSHYSVKLWTRGEVEDLYDMRASLEGLAGARAAERANSAEIAYLEGLVSETPALSFADASGMERALLENTRFHVEIMKMSKIPALGEMARMVVPNALLRRIIWSQGAEDAEQSSKMHRKIVGAIADRSAPLARLMMREDIYASREAVIVVIEELASRPRADIAEIERLGGTFEHDGRRFGLGTREAGADGRIIPFGAAGSKPGVTSILTK